MSQLITIEGNTRTGTGKSFCRALRRSGKLPANLMSKTGTTMIEIDPKFLSVAWKGDKKFTLHLEGKEIPVIIKELQINSVKRTPLHVDLMPL